MAFDDDVKITINLNKLVDTRARILTQYEDYSNAVATGEYLDENDVDRIAVKLRETLTWDTLYSMVDSAIFDYMGLKDPNQPNYGEIQPEPGREAMLNESPLGACHASTAARTASANTLCRSQTFSRPSSNNMSSASRIAHKC